MKNLLYYIIAACFSIYIPIIKYCASIQPKQKFPKELNISLIAELFFSSNLKNV